MWCLGTSVDLVFFLYLAGNICDADLTVKGCFPPLFPLNSTIANGQRKTYLPGHVIKHKCDKGFHLSAKEDRTCESTGWKGEMPFCDPLLKIAVFVWNRSDADCTPLPKLNDKDASSCHTLNSNISSNVRVIFENEMNVTVVRMNSPEGHHAIYFSFDNGAKSNESCEINPSLDQGNWYSFTCKNTSATKHIDIRRTKTEKSLQICEIEVYGAEASSCKGIPPAPDSYNLMLNRKIALMKCDNAGVNYNTIYLCENYEWKLVGKYACNEHYGEYHKFKATVIAVSSVGVVLTLCAIIFGIVIYKKRQRPVVFVVRKNENVDPTDTNNVYGVVEGAEYAAVNYDEIPLTNYSEIETVNCEEIPLPQAKRPTGCKNILSTLPDILGEYADPTDSKGGSKSSKENIDMTEYAYPQDSLASKSYPEMRLKISPLYANEDELK